MWVVVPLNSAMSPLWPTTRAMFWVGLQAEAKIGLVIPDRTRVTFCPSKTRKFPPGPAINAEESSGFHVILSKVSVLGNGVVGMVSTETAPLDMLIFSRVLLSP